MSEYLICVYCGKTITTLRDENDHPQCISCGNNQYSADLSAGRRIELKIDMRKVRESTLLQIQALIQRDIEEYENQNK